MVRAYSVPLHESVRSTTGIYPSSGTSGPSPPPCPRNQSARKPPGPELWFAIVVSLHLLVIGSEVLPHTGQHTQHAFRHPPVRGEQE